MYQITLKIDGMACSMCESHVCDTIRNQFKVKKVSASHAKGEAVIVSETELSEAELKAALDPTGYKLPASHTKKRAGCSPFLKSKNVFCKRRMQGSLCPAFFLPILQFYIDFTKPRFSILRAGGILFGVRTRYPRK